MNPADDPHRQVWDLLPWVVGGSADEAMRRSVQEHVAVCPQCRDEYEFQCRVRDGLLQDEPATVAPDAALARLWQRIDAEAPVPAAAAAEAPAARPAQAQPLAVQAPRWTPWLAAAVVVQAVALALLAGALLHPSGVGEGAITLSSPAPARAAGVELRVAPRPELTLGQWQAFLATERLQVAEVSANGRFYGLKREVGSAPLDELRLQRLRVAPQLLMVETVHP